MNKSKQAQAAATDAVGAEPREIDIHEIVGPGREVTIRHNGQRYRLRITANQKLILTK